jgi:hypothetical protein
MMISFGLAGHDDAVVRAEGERHEVPEGEIAAQGGEAVRHRVAKDIVVLLTAKATIADIPR